MPNAMDADLENGASFYIVGPLDSGKTMVPLTFKGKKFWYVIDSGAMRTIRGYDVDFEEFVPTKMNFSVRRIPKALTPPDPKIHGKERLNAQAFARWEEHFIQSLDNGFFEQYDVIVLDGTTALVDAMLQDVSAREGRSGFKNTLDDYGVVAEQMRNIMTTFCAIAVQMGKVVVMIGHTMMKMNESLGSEQVLNEIMVPGQTKLKGPALFTGCLLASYEDKAIGSNYVRSYYLQSFQDRYNKVLKGGLRGLPRSLDVTIKDYKNPESYGLGRFFRDYVAKERGGVVEEPKGEASASS